MTIKQSLVFAGALALLSCSKKKERTCKCSVLEEGTMTTETKFSALILTSSSNTSVPYSNTSTSTYVFDKVSEKDMHAACPTKTEEEINEKTVSSATGTLAIEITQTNVGKRTKTCSVE